MADPEEQPEEGKKRAELFDALSHPTRIRILKVLDAQPLTFAEIKRTSGIESSGHMQHHLAKLGDLIKQTEGGKYALSDDGKEALRVLETIRSESLHTEIRVEEGGQKDLSKRSAHRPFEISVPLVIVLAIPTALSIIASNYARPDDAISALLFIGSWLCFDATFAVGALIQHLNYRTRALLSLGFLFLSAWPVLVALTWILSPSLRESPFFYVIAVGSILGILPSYFHIASSMIKAYEQKLPRNV